MTHSLDEIHHDQANIFSRKISIWLKATFSSFTKINRDDEILPMKTSRMEGMSFAEFLQDLIELGIISRKLRKFIEIEIKCF